MKRTPFKRKITASSDSKGLFDHIPKEKKNLFAYLDKPSKDEEWALIREELKSKFVNAGIISCEARLQGCIKSYNFGFGWTFAHSLKRDKIPSEKDNSELRNKLMRQVIYACVVCHNTIEGWGNKENKMHDFIIERINGRPKQPC